MLRATLETQKMFYGAPGGYLRLERANSLSPPILFVKLPTDVIKAILLDAPFSLFGSLVLVGGITIPLVGLRIADVVGDSFRCICYQPMVEARQIQLWCEAAKTPQLKVSFLNEIIIPVVEGSLAVNTARGTDFAAIFSNWTQPDGDIPEATQERALDTFEKHLSADDRANTSNDFKTVSVPVKLESKEVLRLTLGTSGDFDLDCANEGANLEQTLHELLASKYSGHAFRSPEVQLDSKKRERTDLLVLSKTEVFLFESKVMAVLERGLDVTAEMRSKRTMKHFQKAIGQLVGAVKQLRKNAPLFTQDGIPLTIASIDQVDVHALVVVSSANLDLDFRQIADELTKAHSQAPASYHFLDLFELQQHIAFSDNAAKLSLHLQRRFEIACGSRNAAIRTRFMRQSVKPVKSSAIPEDATGYVLAFVALPRTDHDPQKLTKTLFRALRQQGLSGRFELYHRILKRGPDVYYDLGVGFSWGQDGQSEIPDAAWWRLFEARLVNLIDPSLGLRLSAHSGVTTLGQIRRAFERVAVMDMEHGEAVSCD